MDFMHQYPCSNSNELYKEMTFTILLFIPDQFGYLALAGWFFFLNEMNTYHEVLWCLDSIILCCFLAMSVFGMIASFRHDQPQKRETAFLYSLFIGIGATWEYCCFGSFGYAFLLSARLMISKMLIIEK